ncbi:CDP-diacylglycerol--glycerol-3-phosphate 3-phosphatidyltransferase-like [Ylistrum balloti]|uniref:CDP-diacylglycerol--glycerol-3-phosphate 3-phosphatidyltransferase-like n=1 Tax=Ylistrum balloti TaxID=509963 RepID=UPI002905BD9F|nr:CDP-diacylglycerol--glycerol-3-phosphate 3-phosphatidyltransferase-like [Ylistrum balloti]
MMGYVLLYVPNIIGYARLCLLALSISTFDTPVMFLIFYSVSAILDGFDGYAARKLNQMSAFGAWFDVIVDLISRGALWCFISKWGYFVMVIEWMTFVATHSRGPSWRIPEKDFPVICRKVMENGFKTPLGTYAITGLHVLPIWLYGCMKDVIVISLGLSPWIQHFGTLFLIGGRLLSLRVEIFFISKYIAVLLSEDDDKIS